MSFVNPVVSDENRQRVRKRVRAQLESNSTDWSNSIFKWAMLATLVFTLLVLLTLLVTMALGSYELFIERTGSFLSNGYTSKSSTRGVFQGLRGTFWIGVCVILFSFPVGISAAIYLSLIHI